MLVPSIKLRVVVRSTDTVPQHAVRYYNALRRASEAANTRGVGNFREVALALGAGQTWKGEYEFSMNSPESLWEFVKNSRYEGNGIKISVSLSHASWAESEIEEIIFMNNFLVRAREFRAGLRE